MTAMLVTDDEVDALREMRFRIIPQNLKFMYLLFKHPSNLNHPSYLLQPHGSSSFDNLVILMLL